MSTETSINADPDVGAAKNAARSALESGQKTIHEALEVAEKSLNDATRRVEKAVREGVETLKGQIPSYRDNAAQQFDEAQQYVLERVKERPVTATLAGLGVGLLLGLLLANRSSK